jgi:OOP family OmpA-OmpF porin
MRRLIVAGIVAGMMMGGPVWAQDASSASKEELLMLFQKQKTRGLKLAPNTAVSAATVTQPAATTETATAVAGTATGAVTGTATAVAGTETAPVAGGETVASGTTEVASGTTVTVAEPVVTAEVAAALPTVAEGAPVPVAYTELDKSEQINFRIGFDFDSAVLRDSEKEKLATLCDALTEIDGTFRIVGHTDAAGTDAYNEKLSLLRAEEVKRYLVGGCGSDAARLEAVGVGKRFLFNEEDPRSEDNRRVEFQALS